MAERASQAFYELLLYKGFDMTSFLLWHRGLHK